MFCPKSQTEVSFRWKTTLYDRVCCFMLRTQGFTRCICGLIWFECKFTFSRSFTREQDHDPLLSFTNISDSALNQGNTADRSMESVS